MSSVTLGFRSPEHTEETLGQRYRSILASLGLVDNEIVVYELLLRHGPQSASALATRAELTRTNTYHVLGQLNQKLLVTRDGSAGKSVFRAEHPDALRNLIARKKESLDEVRRELEEGFAEIVADYGLGEDKPGVYRFTGKFGLVRAYDEMLRDRSHLSSIEDRARLRAVLPDYYPEFVGRRLESGLRHRIICPGGRPIGADDEGELREVRYIRRRNLPFDIDLKIARNKILIVNFKDKNVAGIVVHDRGIATSFLALFEVVWRTLG
jgi:sugar-specific transcriptional regulator TrmB